MKHPLSLCSVAVGLWISVDLCGAIDPASLQAQLKARQQRITVVDVRGSDQFGLGHIPGAINVPAAVVGDSKLPPLGRVVVYDDGLGRELADNAVAQFNQKPGITAEKLDGGYSAWRATAGVTTTQGRGIEKEQVPMLTYQDLKTLKAEDVVLVDLRQADSSDSKTSAKSTVSTNRLSDLRTEFPSARITRTPFQIPGARVGLSDASPAPQPLLVLIDNGDGAAYETARALRANGVTRYVILAGGEQAIQRQGQKGSQRIGSNAILSGSSVTAPKSNP